MIRFLARIGGKRNEQLINELIKSTDEVGHPFMTQIKIFGHAEGNDFYTALASLRKKVSFKKSNCFAD